jgi:DNA polymerase V
MLKVIPIKAQAGVSGFESPAAEYTEMNLDLDSLLIDNPSATFIGMAQGHSMVGVGIFDNDLLIVSRSTHPREGDVVVANLNGEFVCKLLGSNKHSLLSASKNYAPYFLSEGDDFQLEGVVISSVRLHRRLGKSLI